MAESTTVRVPALRARLIQVPFEHLVRIFSGKLRITNLPETSYVRSVNVNMNAECFDLMVIDPSYEPLENLGDMPSEPAAIVDVVSSDVPKAKKKK